MIDIIYAHSILLTVLCLVWPIGDFYTSLRRVDINVNESITGGVILIKLACTKCSVLIKTSMMFVRSFIRIHRRLRTDSPYT